MLGKRFLGKCIQPPRLHIFLDLPIPLVGLDSANQSAKALSSSLVSSVTDFSICSSLVMGGM